ncbi:MAG: hypothetical protein RMI01_05010 [Thermodesulfovibrio sp.]|nr:hypothetical protein [Thermodesulfovibrio sp.]
MKKQRRKFTDIVFLFITAITAFSVIAISLGIFIVLFKKSLPAINKFGITGFILSTEWDPIKEILGAASALIVTLITSFFALLLAVPIAIGIAIFITEIAPSFLKEIIGTAIELFAVTPIIIYGMWGLFTLAPIMSRYIEPFLQPTVGKLPLIGKLFEGTSLRVELLTASIILSIMNSIYSFYCKSFFNLTPS